MTAPGYAPGWATVGALAARGDQAVAYCANPACHRFRDFAGVGLDLSAMPAEFTIDRLAGALACSSCDRRSAEIVTTPPRWISRADLAAIFGPASYAPERRAEPAPVEASPPSPIEAPIVAVDPADHPLVKAALAAFPGAVIVAVRRLGESDANDIREGLS